MTVVAAAVAIMSFSETERGFERVSTREVPMMTDALRLSVASGEISAAAARYVSAKSSDDRKLIAAQIASRSRDLDQIMDRLRVGQGDGGGFSIAEPMAKRLKENLKALEQAISERTDIRDNARCAARRTASGAQQDQRQAHPDRRRQLFRGRHHGRGRRPERRHHGAHADPGRHAGDAGDGRGRRRDQPGHRPAHRGRADLLAGHPGDAGGPLHGFGAARRKAARQAPGRHQVRAAEGKGARAGQARRLQAARQPATRPSA